MRAHSLPQMEMHRLRWPMEVARKQQHSQRAITCVRVCTCSILCEDYGVCEECEDCVQAEIQPARDELRKLGMARIYVTVCMTVWLWPFSHPTHLCVCVCVCVCVTVCVSECVHCSG